MKSFCFKLILFLLFMTCNAQFTGGSDRTQQELLRTQLSELTHGLGWQILSHEKYPRYDKITSFMNRALIPILIVSVICMFFLAYWSSSITSGSSLYSGGGWMVSGSTGGKNAALRRTLEIIAEQKLRFEARRQSMHSAASGSAATKKQAFIVYKSNARLQASAAPPRSLATSSAVEHYATAQRAAPLTRTFKERGLQKNKSPQASSLASIEQQKHRRNSSSTNSASTASTSASGRKISGTTPSLCTVTTTGNQQATTTFSNNGNKQPGTSTSQGPSDGLNSFRERLESMDVVPELIVMHSHNESVDTTDTHGRKISLQGHRRHSRRFSVSDEFKRKKNPYGSSASSRPKRWKAGSLMFSRFSFRRPK